MNTSIICVDDEPGIIEAYVNTLAANKGGDGDIQNMLARRKRRKVGETEPTASVRQPYAYDVFTASSGEEAVEIVREQLAASRQIAVGFFDMAMPGGIDGAETIRRIRELDKQMLCAVVTAYTDRSTHQLGNLFERQDDWLYFNKPFSSGELEQTAYHLVTAWNQRRREESLVTNLEMMQNGLLWILKAVGNINRIPPLVMEALLEGLLRHYLKLIQADDGFIYLPQNNGPVYFGLGKFGACEILVDRGRELQWSMARQAMDQNRQTIIDGNMAATPLIVGDESLGILFAETRETIDHDPRLFDMYATQAVNMIHNSTLYEELNIRNLELNRKNQELMELLDKLTQSENLQQKFKKLSLIDTLTGIHNRRYVETQLQEDINQARREGVSAACLMVDIDHFKLVNDTYGHNGGDYVLQEVAKVFKQHTRTGDTISRYGGEEFLVFYMDIDREYAEKLCERLRKSVEDACFVFGSTEIKVTVSIGCAVFVPSVHDTVNGIIAKADQALYMAKAQGRNRFVFFDDHSVDEGENHGETLIALR
ncbi:GGDEF domain-containing response regulator [Thiocystis violacea]|uniref:GGDEF domain-containing response regulator n=1 Tax=Thiocystis violacea TaxID=13725 RepID=UPI0019051CCC|nr:diguanylate cyclase [Thiocystis violacea]